MLLYFCSCLSLICSCKYDYYLIIKLANVIRIVILAGLSHYCTPLGKVKVRLG